MSAISPTLNFPQSDTVFANSSPVVSTEANQARPLHPFSRIDLEQCMNKMAGLAQGDVRKPTQNALESASEWLYLIFDRANKLGGWSRPHISSTEDGDLVFEWWRGKRNLTLYFGEDGPDYIEVWGPNIDHDMVSGQLTNWSFSNVWLRLQS